MKNHKSSFLVKTTKNFILASSLISLVSTTAYSAQLTAAQLAQAKKNLTERMLETEDLLRVKGFIITKEQTGMIHGQIKGALNGNYSETSRFSSALGLSILGLFAGFVTGGLALPGLVGGALIGGVLPEEVGAGSLTGELNGSLTGKNWENVKDGSVWGAVIIEPSQIDRIEKFNDTYDSKNSQCAADYLSMIEKIKKTKKYFTRTEAKKILDDIAKMRDLATDIEKSLPSIKDKNEFKSYISSFFEKKILFSSVGVKFSEGDQLGIATDLAYSVDFIGLKYKVEGDTEFKSLPKFHIDEQTTSSELAEQSLNTLKKYVHNKGFVFRVQQYKNEKYFEFENLGYITSSEGLFIYKDSKFLSSEPDKYYYFDVKYNKELTTNLSISKKDEHGFEKNMICKTKEDLSDLLKTSYSGAEVSFQELSSNVSNLFSLTN